MIRGPPPPPPGARGSLTPSSNNNFTQSRRTSIEHAGTPAPPVPPALVTVPQFGGRAGVGGSSNFPVRAGPPAGPPPPSAFNPNPNTLPSKSASFSVSNATLPPPPPRGASQIHTGANHIRQFTGTPLASISDSQPWSASDTESSPNGSMASPPTNRQTPAQSRSKDLKRDCKVDGCFSKAEIGGSCIKHYYSAATPVGRTTSLSLENAAKLEDERRKLCEELVTTEKSYGRGLKSVVKGMILRLKKYEEMGKPLMDAEEMQKVFLNLADIYDLQQKLYHELKGLRFDRELIGPRLGKVLLTFSPFFRLYVFYVNNYDESQKALAALRETRPALDAFFQHCELCEGGRIADFSIMPVQRVPRYALLLRGIEKTTADNDESLSGVRAALTSIENVANDINESFRKKEARNKVIEMSTKIEGLDFQLVTPHRIFVKEGPLDKKYNKTSFKMNDFKQYHFILFSDLLLYTTMPDSKGNCKVKYSLPLSSFELAHESDSTKYPHSFWIKNDVKSFLVLASSAQEKSDWMTVIEQTRDALLRNTASLKIQPSKSQLARDGGSFSVASSHSGMPAPPPGGRSGGFGSYASQTLGPGFKMPVPPPH